MLWLDPPRHWNAFRQVWLICPNGFVADECENVGGCSRIYKYSTNVTCLRTESGYGENP